MEQITKEVNIGNTSLLFKGVEAGGVTPLLLTTFLYRSVADPNPDPRVFGPPGYGSGSISQRYGSGSGSFYNEAKV